MIRNFFFADPLSATAPKKGEIHATIIEASEFAKPRWYVLCTTSDGLDQYFSKKIGKNPAATVVENVEFAQSYKAQL